MVDVKNTRIEIAKKKNIKFDTRTPEEFFFDAKKENSNLQPAFYYSPLFDNFNTFEISLTTFIFFLILSIK